MDIKRLARIVVLSSVSGSHSGMAANYWCRKSAIDHRYNIPYKVRFVVDRVRRLSLDVLGKHRSEFGGDFADNKKALDDLSIIRSKGLKNEIAGYITKVVKDELRAAEAREQARAKEEAEESARRLAEESAASLKTNDDVADVDTDTVDATLGTSIDSSSTDSTGDGHDSAVSYEPSPEPSPVSDAGTGGDSSTTVPNRDNDDAKPVTDN